jgi:hypothetical protein
MPFQPWQQLSRLNAHPRDEHIAFHEPTHKYYVNGTCEGNISCTGFIHEFFGHFNPKAILTKMRRNPTKWAASKYFGKTDEEITKEWNDNNQDLLIQPGNIPLYDPDERNEAIYYLPQGWDPVLEGDIDGLVHLSDISWTEPGEKAIRDYKKGQDIEAVILAIDAERERISLGIKQLESDIYTDYLNQ